MTNRTYAYYREDIASYVVVNPGPYLAKSLLREGAVKRLTVDGLCFVLPMGEWPKHLRKPALEGRSAIKTRGLPPRRRRQRKHVKKECAFLSLHPTARAGTLALFGLAAFLAAYASTLY